MNQELNNTEKRKTKPLTTKEWFTFFIIPVNPISANQIEYERYERFGFTAVSCQIFTNYKKLDELTNLNINGISFMFKPNKLKTRAGFTMNE